MRGFLDEAFGQRKYKIAVYLHLIKLFCVIRWLSHRFD